MEFKILTKFKNQLAGIKKEIEKKIKSLYKTPDFGDEVDSDEESDETTEFDKQLSIAQTYKERLTNVDSALNKIDEGKYGICGKCGAEISLDVLEASPESRLCKKCKGLSRNF
ncbi:MAG: TraR/DksA family transcriptional regulator [Patescibacteria group bacterium]